MNVKYFYSKRQKREFTYFLQPSFRLMKPFVSIPGQKRRNFLTLKAREVRTFISPGILISSVTGMHFLLLSLSFLFLSFSLSLTLVNDADWIEDERFMSEVLLCIQDECQGENRTRDPSEKAILCTCDRS